MSSKAARCVFDRPSPVVGVTGGAPSGVAGAACCSPPLSAISGTKPSTGSPNANEPSAGSRLSNICCVADFGGAGSEMTSLSEDAGRVADGGEGTLPAGATDCAVLPDVGGAPGAD